MYIHIYILHIYHLLCQWMSVWSEDKITGLKATKSRSKNTFQPEQDYIKKTKSGTK